MYHVVAVTEDLPRELGRYRILRRLGTGGMAEVFLAKSTGAEGIEKILVLKRVLPSFARSAKFISMFVDEAKVAMRLNHPNIVQVYAFEQVRREFLLAMEFVDGLDLGRMVSAVRRQEGHTPYGLCAYIVQEVAKGLDYAHKRKDEGGVPMEIVHRDVSPQNVLLSYDGVVKVADFGIAKAKLVSEETGVIKGKFAYMSPEQARGERVDHRSDVYSLGVLFAELLMNRVMYPGRHGLDVLEAVRDAQLTLPSEVNPNVPRGLERIVRRATSPDPEERYQTARSLAGAITQYLHGQDQVWDGEALEGYLREIAPREATSPDGKRAVRTFSEGQTVLSGMSTRESRERRRVVVLAGRIREGDTTTRGEASVGAEAAKVLEDIAYKADAVVSWPDGQGKSRFRFIIGLGKTSVNDPLKAVRIATDTIEALEGLSADLLAPISASIGLSRGMVSTVRDATGRLIRYAPVGIVLEVAERLAEVGEADEILAAGAVFRLVRRDFAFDPEQREIDVRTEAGETAHGISAWRLRGARTREQRQADAPEHDGELIGRGSEVETLDSLYRDVRDLSRTLFVGVVGELGVGKTALVSAALGRLGSSPRVLRSECTFGSIDVPFTAVADLVRDAADIPDGATAKEAARRLEAAVRKRIEDETRVRACIAGLSPLVGAVDARDLDEGDHFRLVTRGVEIFVAALATEGPLVIWVDNLQWIDTPSLELLHAMRQQNYEVPCLVVVSTRPEPRLLPVLGSIPQIELRELPVEVRADLVRARFDAEVPDEIVTAIETRAGGNPFFVGELVDALLERGVVEIEDRGDVRRVLRKPGVPIQLPTTLEGVVAARLDELSEPERLAVRWLSVAGAGLRIDDVSRLTGADAHKLVEELTARGLFLERAGGALAFASAVVRQVAYEATDIEDRMRMHRRIAQLLQARQDEAPGRIARHLEQAGERAAAARAYLDAADAARRVYSNREALRFFGRGLQLLAPDDHDSRFRAHEGREQILRFLGRPQEQLLELEAMRGIARRSGGPRRRAVALLRMARFELDGAKPEGAVELLDDAMSAARASGDPSLELDALRITAEVARGRGDAAGALAACDEAIERAGTSRNLLPARGQVLVQKGIVLRRHGRADEAFEAYTEAIVIFRRLGIRRAEAFALNSLGVALTSNGLYEDAITTFRASIHIDRQTGDRLRLGRKLSNVGQLYDALGDVSQGLAFVQRALDVFEAVDDRAGRCDALSAIAEMMLEAGSAPRDAAVPLDQARRIAERLGSGYELARERLVRAELEHRDGNLEAAKEAALAAIEAATSEGLVGYELHGKARLAAVLSEQDDASASEIAREARARLVEGVEVERAERIHLLLAEAFDRSGDESEAQDARAAARTVIEAQAAAIRSEQLRTRFTESRMKPARRP